MLELPDAECYRIKAIEPIYRSSRAERERWLKEAEYNAHCVEAGQVYIDLVTDSGIAAMSSEQWASLMLADEAYIGAQSFFNLKAAVKKICGFDYTVPAHQGRAAENILFSSILKEGDIIPGNEHFITTKGHILRAGAKIAGCAISELSDVNDTTHPFKGNFDLQKLQSVLSENQQIPLILVTVTSSFLGGQPVSMQNIKAVHQLAKQRDILICFDACRFAENAYFIKTREEGYGEMTIKDIVKEMLSYCDIMVMSGKKDGYCNMGGFLAFRDEELARRTHKNCAMYEGWITYGGMSGRDMNTLAQGLDEATEFECLHTRIKQVEYLGAQLDKYGVPILKPVGGSCVFVDAGTMLPNVPRSQFPSLVLVNELYLEAGVRSTEVGSVMAGRDPVTGCNNQPERELVRLSVPRRTYTNCHMDVVAVALSNLLQRGKHIHTGYEFVDEDEGGFRHMMSTFKPVP